MERTIRMPDLAQELHLGRVQGIVLGELEFGGEDATLEGRAFGPLDQRLPHEQVVFVDWARRDPVRRTGQEGFVLLKEPLGCDAGGGHVRGVSAEGCGVCARRSVYWSRGRVQEKEEERNGTTKVCRIEQVFGGRKTKIRWLLGRDRRSEQTVFAYVPGRYSVLRP